MNQEEAKKLLVVKSLQTLINQTDRALSNNKGREQAICCACLEYASEYNKLKLKSEELFDLPEDLKTTFAPDKYKLSTLTTSMRIRMTELVYSRACDLRNYLQNEIKSSFIFIELPKTEDADLKILRSEILDKVNHRQPDLVLDRLHTFSMKYLQIICEQYGIPTKKDNKESLPINSLLGGLIKYCKEKNLLESEFTESALKSSISLFTIFNDIRNNKSYAHPNKVLNEEESWLVIIFISTSLNFLDRLGLGHH